MAPVERRGQRVLSRRGCVAAAAEHSETVIEPLCDHLRTECPEASGGEFQCERKAVEAEADPGNVEGVALVEHKVRMGRSRAVHKQADGLKAK